MEISNAQISDLAISLITTVLKFYENPENEEKFQRWLLDIEKQKDIQNVT